MPILEDSSDLPTPLHGAPLLMKVNGGAWSAPSTTSYGTESALRDLLANNPSIIPGIVDPLATAVIELAIPGVGRADVVVVETSGVITICEAKLATNADVRRTVVGQVFAYAAGLSEMDIDGFEAAWAQRGQGKSLADSLLGADATDEDREVLRSSIADSLAHGRFRLLLAVDRLTDELRLIVGYLARHLDVRVVALELAYAAHGGVEVVVPRTWGTELSTSASGSTEKASGRSAQLSDVLDSVVAAAEIAAVGFGQIVRVFLTSLGPIIDTLYSGQADMTDPVLVAKGPPPCQPAKIITSQTMPGIRICFQWCRYIDSARVNAALVLLESHPLLAPSFVGVREAQFRRRPLVPYSGVLDQSDVVDVMIEAVRVIVG